MFTKVIVLALAALAVAGPSRVARASAGGNTDSSCGKNSKVYCCNAETAQKLSQKGTLPVDAHIAEFQSLLGQCNDIRVNILLTIDPLKKQCSQETVCCGTTKQNGVANFGCTTVHT